MPNFAKKKSLKLDEKPMPVKQLEENEIANLYKSLKNIRWTNFESKSLKSLNVSTYQANLGQ